MSPNSSGRTLAERRRRVLEYLASHPEEDADDIIAIEPDGTVVRKVIVASARFSHTSSQRLEI